MKCSSLLAPAFALAVGLAGTALAADLVDETFEASDMPDEAATAINGVAHSNLTWSAGSADRSKVKNGALAINTEGDTLVAEIDDDAASTLNSAFGASKPEGATGEIYVNADVDFIPSDELETFDGTANLKFAVYAYDNGTTTNLVVYHGGSNGGENEVTSYVFDDLARRRLVVTMKNDNNRLMFQVKLGDTVVTGANDVVWFPVVAGDSVSVSALNFQGTGTVDNLKIGYAETKGFKPGDSEFSKAGYTLTQAGADFLNGVLESSKATKEAVAAKAVELASDGKLDAAMALNMDFMKDENYDGSYSFGITGIKRTGDDVVVTITLDRGNYGNGAIKGTLTLQSSTDAVNYDTTVEQPFSDADFSEGDTTTVTFGAGGATFFKGVISTDESATN